jgi:hypothetical protein
MGRDWKSHLVEEVEEERRAAKEPEWALVVRERVPPYLDQASGVPLETASKPPLRRRPPSSEGGGSSESGADEDVASGTDWMARSAAKHARFAMSVAARSSAATSQPPFLAPTSQGVVRPTGGPRRPRAGFRP